ncbi:broad-specificity cellobiase [Pelagirhabdus alkalitolerans]|uniref:Beta-glucosidase n=1 Tax=Pelagirhabdus alkalitolerans TaxID=1612202 RepID=A0A1G6JZE3_9BACI|nr:GH1 family beta-glucosidase [Pelagirhabdus alkalitolerans]SDC24110.1 broad-specificity cellobiase [Pelagirhabdus alkalitolerans]
MKFDSGFTFGTSTSSYQIEGAVSQDGRTPSIWDTFSRIPGKVMNADNGDVACDHYNRYKEDVQYIKELGVEKYRFSIAWPRIFPREGEYNPLGMDFYKRLIKELIENDIKPVVTLYHWDMPQWAYDKGGWLNRESIQWFLDYAQVVIDELDADVDSWITHNEPWCAAFLGYQTGVHAPGHADVEESLIAAHHMLVSHGEVVRYLKNKKQSDTPIGITLNLSPIETVSNDYNDLIALTNADGYQNRWFLDPIFKGDYPSDVINLFSTFVNDFSFIQQGDLDIASTPTDFLGINYYSRGLVEFSSKDPFLYKAGFSDYEKTGMGWDISPEAFKDLIYRLREDYTTLPIVITENGAAYPDEFEHGEIHDVKRVDYIKKHLKAVAELNTKGMNISGYFVWSLFDNFEWAFGYDKRFGIIHVDFKTQKRTLKESAKFYKDVVKSRSIEEG